MTTDPSAPSAPPPASDATLGELVSRMSEQTSKLIRDELRLAQLEMTEKGKKVGIGAGLFSGAGIFALYGLACLITAAILGLAGPVPDWVAAIIVGAVLFVIAGTAALLGKREVSEAAPAVPEDVVSGLKQDVQTLKPGSHHD
jgi:uncharacterized membrane protein YqjE